MSEPADETPAGVRWRLGTMGFSYADWTGPFYPKGIRPSQRLGAYAQAFDTVELDTTFHATPSREVVRRWAEAVPESFRFTAKLPRQVTHSAADGVSLVSRASREATLDFLRTMEVLGPKLRAVLMQFPPAFGAEHFQDLAALVQSWPAEVPAAVELRHDSWWQPGVGPATARLLRERNMAWVCADEPPQEIADTPPEAPEATAVYRPRPAVLTADWFYVRWIGRHEQFPDLAEERLDPTPRLRWWADNLRKLADSGRVKEIVGFFNNGYSGHSPAAMRRMRQLLGLSTSQTPAERSSLFPSG